MEAIFLALFCAALIACIAADLSVLYAMIAGYALFFTYGLLKKHSVRDLLRMTLRGMSTVKNIMLVFCMIGILTAMWRASGTIPMIICSAAGAIRPAVCLLVVFLLNCLVSSLIGTSFGTAATVGVICMAVGRTIGVSPAWLGGAILGGAFFGDRCSPMSTSAHLVCELTGTDIYGNIKAMLRTGAVPLLCACAVYLAAGLRYSGAAFSADALDILRAGFEMHWLLLLPAALIIVMSLLRINIRWVMLTSIVVSAALGAVFQHVGIGELLRFMLTGYRAPSPELAAILDGGGLVSMIRVSVIVLISATYSGIFEGTGMITGLEARANSIFPTSPYCATLLTAVAASLISCNQTLAIMLTEQIRVKGYGEKRALALDLEDSAVAVSPLVPWSIASAVPLTVIGAPTASVFLACYLWLLPLWRLISAEVGKKRARRHEKTAVSR